MHEFSNFKLGPPDAAGGGPLTVVTDYMNRALKVTRTLFCPPGGPTIEKSASKAAGTLQTQVEQRWRKACWAWRRRCTTPI